MAKVARILRKLAEQGFSQGALDKIEGDLRQKNLDELALPYLVAKPDGWHVFTDDPSPFRGENVYFVVEWRGL
jgi:hypothetical protein